MRFCRRVHGVAELAWQAELTYMDVGFVAPFKPPYTKHLRQLNTDTVSRPSTPPYTTHKEHYQKERYSALQPEIIKLYKYNR